MPVVGWLRAGELPSAEYLAAFRQGLNELGYIEGRNVKIELRNSEQYDRLPDLASEFARRPVTAMFADNLAAAVAARAATATIPIVFAIGGDPIRDGLVTSLSRPTGNLTGVTFFAGELLPKRLALLRQLVPKADLVAVLLNPTNPNLFCSAGGRLWPAAAHSRPRGMSAAGGRRHRSAEGMSAFDPLLPSAVQIFCVAKFLFDHFVGGREERFRHLDAEKPRGL
jgi:ABC transporter substrate binding protein